MPAARRRVYGDYLYRLHTLQWQRQIRREHSPGTVERYEDTLNQRIGRQRISDISRFDIMHITDVLSEFVSHIGGCPVSFLPVKARSSMFKEVCRRKKSRREHTITHTADYLRNAHHNCPERLDLGIEFLNLSAIRVVNTALHTGVASTKRIHDRVTVVQKQNRIEVLPDAPVMQGRKNDSLAILRVPLIDGREKHSCAQPFLGRGHDCKCGPCALPGNIWNLYPPHRLFNSSGHRPARSKRPSSDQHRFCHPNKRSAGHPHAAALPVQHPSSSRQVL